MTEAESTTPLLSNDDPLSCGEEPPDTQKNVTTKELLLYKRRWFILFIYSMNTAVSGFIFVGLSPISNVASTYYNESAVLIEWLSNSFLILYSIFALPTTFAMFRFGVRAVLTIASGLQAIGTIFHYFGYEQDKFWSVGFGQFLAALSFCTLLQIPGQLSSKWFPENERATSTSIGILMNVFGVAVGFLQTTLMVKESSNTEVVSTGLQNLFLLQLTIAVLVFLLTTCGYREEPPTPASYITIIDGNESFYADLKCLMYDKNFQLMSQAYGIYYALFATFAVILNAYVTLVYPVGYNTKIGWMGFTGLIAAMLSMILSGIWIDKYHSYKMVAVLSNAFSGVLWLLFVVVLTQTKNFTAAFILYSVFGAVSVQYFSVGIEQAAEMTYPVKEVTSSTFILTLGNLYGFVLVLTLGILTDSGYIQTVGFIMTSLYFLATLLLISAKTNLKRRHAEEEAMRMKNTVEES